MVTMYNAIKSLISVTVSLTQGSICAFKTEGKNPSNCSVHDRCVCVKCALGRISKIYIT